MEFRSNRKTNQREVKSFNEKLLELEKEKLRLVQNRQNLTDDDDYNFLMSLLPDHQKYGNMGEENYNLSCTNC